MHAFRSVVEITDEFGTLAYINIGDINIGDKMTSDLFSAAIAQRWCIRPRECSNAGMRCMSCLVRLVLAKLLHMTGGPNLRNLLVEHLVVLAGGYLIFGLFRSTHQSYH